MPAGLSLALLKALEGLNKEPDWPNTPGAVYLRMPKPAPARLIKPLPALRKNPVDISTTYLG